MSTVALVASREIATRLRSRAFVISTTIVLVVIIAGTVLTSVLTAGSDEARKVALVGGASSIGATLRATGTQLGTPVTTSTISSEAKARSAVAAGEVDLALVPAGGGGYTALTGSGLSDALSAVVDTAVRQQATAQALTSRGVDPAAVATAVASAQVRVDQTDPAPAIDGQRLALAFVAVFLLYFQLITNGAAVASGVVEEKTSRVVEVLLSTIRPVQLLTGKIIGIGVVGFVSLFAYGAVALVASTATGALDITATAVSVFAATMGWYVLGYAFFAVLYAAAGSMVSRQEEVASATTPLTVLIVAMFVLAQSTAQDPTGTLSSIMAWIPPFSAILMPLRIAAGVTGPLQIVATIALMALATAGLSLVAAKIYQRSVLRTGTRVTWRQALGRT